MDHVSRHIVAVLQAVRDLPGSTEVISCRVDHEGWDLRVRAVGDMGTRPTGVPVPDFTDSNLRVVVDSITDIRSPRLPLEPAGARFPFSHVVADLDTATPPWAAAPEDQPTAGTG